MKRLLIIASCLAALPLPASALASCVYNKAHTPINVNFICDTDCHDHWTIHPTYHKCRAGEAGEVTVRVMDAYNKNEIGDRYCTLKVGKHGWVTVYQDGKDITVISKENGGLEKHTCEMRIMSDPN